ncbi:MAG: hypothetical protein M0R66_06220 [Candidatus Omnitrophica bacterium]|nr:hypothetical protein [Candidatus Omnitrophota bacterium]
MEIAKINKKMIMGIFFLAALFLAILPDQLWGEPAQEKPGDKKSTEIPDEAKIEDRFPGIIVRPKAEFKEEGLRDPFRDYFEEAATSSSRQAGEGAPGAPPEEKLPPLKVQGIIYGGRLSQAIINDKIVKIGDNIEGAQVTNIEKDGVTVFFGHKSYNISSPAAGILKDLNTKTKEASNEK